MSENFTKSLLASVKLLLSILFSIFLANYFSERKKLLNYVKFITIIILIVAIDGWIQFILGKNVLGFKVIEGHGTRLSGFFGDEAILGSFISKLSFIVLFMFYFIKKNIYIAILASLFLILSTLITSERMAFIIICFGFFNFFIFYIFKKKNFKLLILIPIIILILSIFIKQNKNIYDQLIVKTDKYFGGISKPLNINESPHGVHWVTAYKIFKDNPYLGSGLKNFRLRCSNENYSTNNKFDHVRCSTHPHNMLFEFLSETGLFGTLFFLIFIFLILFKKIHYLFDPLFFTISLSIVLFLWPLGTSGSFFSTWNGSFFWFFLGLLLAVKKNLNSKNNEIKKKLN